MTNISKKDVFVALFIAISILLLTFGCVYAVRSQTAYADYESDYINNPQAIVNFNQFVSLPVSNISSNVSSSYYTTINSFQYVANHKIFIKSNFDANISGQLLGLGNNNGVYEYIKGIYIFEYTGNLTFNSIIYKSGLQRGVYYINFVDLTQMFGVGNEPTLSQCQDIFVADYYAYNTGTPIPFSGYEAYNLGVIDTLNSYNNFAVNLSAISSAFIDSSLNNSNAFVRKFYEPSNTDYSYYLQARGYLSIPFNTTIDNGSLISFKYYDPGQGGSGNYLWCGVYYQNSFYPVMYIGDLTGETITFASPVSTQYLMFADSSTRDYFTFSDSAYWLGDFIVDNAKFDMNALLDSARTNAYAEKDQYYQTYYGQNGTGYNSIYNSGYQTGLNAQLDEANRHFYTFPQFLGALFDVPVKTITSLLDFEVLGFNLKNFFFSLITLSIIFALIKFILVRTGDK